MAKSVILALDVGKLTLNTTFLSHDFTSKSYIIKSAQKCFYMYIQLEERVA